MNNLSQEQLKSSLFYAPETGEFVWLKTRQLTRRRGKVAGSLRKRTGYVFLKLFGRSYAAHRVAWMYVYGDWPEKIIDHINGNRSDNKIANLRECSTSQNAMNRPANKNKNGGVKAKGVTIHKASGKFQAAIVDGGEWKYLGLHETEGDAASAYDAACVMAHGAFARTNDKCLEPLQ